jgi:hypothetical protein
MLAVLLLVTAPPLAAQGVRWTGSTSYSRGSYVFDEATSTLSISNGLALVLGRVELNAALPFMLQNSGLVNQVAGIPLPTGGRESGVIRGRGAGETIGSRSGRTGTGAGQPSQTLPGEVTYQDEFTWAVGDPYLSASGAVYEGTGLLRSVRAQVAAKAPLRGIESGVGTGEWDVGVGGSAFSSIGGTFVFADVSRWWFGDLPDLELRDGLTYGAGLSRSVLDARGSVMVSFFGASALIESMARPASLALGLSYSPRLGRSISGGVAAGLSEASPDVSVYMGWSLTLR